MVCLLFFKNDFGKRAKDGTRTRDLRLGKPALYQLSYFRLWIGQLVIGQVMSDQ